VDFKLEKPMNLARNCHTSISRALLDESIREYWFQRIFRFPEWISMDVPVFGYIHIA
jgi:hypothetical protein